MPPGGASAQIDPRDADLARSLVTDITLTLCKSGLYEVVAPFTARQLAGGLKQQVSVQADYRVRIDLIEGAGSLPGSRLAVNVVTASGAEILRHEIELRSGLLLDIHYGLCASLVDRICGQIGKAEILRYRRTGAASAYVHFLLALKRADRTDLPSLIRAQKSLSRAVELSPDYAPALSELARTKTLEWLERASPDNALLREAKHLAERAQLYEPECSAGLREIGHASLYLRDPETALASYEAAQALAPNHADLLADQADVLTHLSQHERAEAKIMRALSLNPLAPDDYYWIGGAVSFFRGRYEEALARLTSMQTPGLALRLMAACAAMANDHESAATYRQQALARDPAFVVDKWTSLYPEPSPTDTAHYLDVLRRAGFPQSAP